MSDTAEYWRDVKEHFRTKRSNRQLSKRDLQYKKEFKFIIGHPSCKKVGDHWRVNSEWDLWHTGTVMNIKTKEYSNVSELSKLIEKNLCTLTKQ